MTIPPLTRAQVRAVDRIAIEDYALSGLVLMENAGRNTATHLLALGVTGRVDVCCGRGNNGGDGFVIARHLANAGVDVRVLLFAPPSELASDAAANFEVIRRMDLPIEIEPMIAAEMFSDAEWIIDALLGTGPTEALRPPWVDIIHDLDIRLQASPQTKVLAVDLPSGLHSDTGEPLGVCLTADHTATFVAPKVGFAAAAALVGQVEVIDIGAPRAIVDRVREEF